MSRDRTARAPIDREDVRRRLIETATDLEVAQLLEMRTTWMESVGDVPVAEGPMSKLFSTEVSVRAAEKLSALAGPDALRTGTTRRPCWAGASSSSCASRSD